MLDLLFHVRIGLHMRAVNENDFRRKIPRAVYLIQNPAKDFFNCFAVKSMLEIMAHRREMRNRFADSVPQEPSVCDVHFDIRHGLPQRTNSIQMLNQDDLKQNNRIDTGSAVDFAV